MFRPAWVTQAQLTSALSAFRGQMPMTSSPRMLFQQEEVWGVGQGFLQSGILSGRRGRVSAVTWLLCPLPPLCTCPSFCCSLPWAPFTPKDKFPPSLVLSLFPIMLLSVGLFEEWGLLKSPGWWSPLFWLGRALLLTLLSGDQLSLPVPGVGGGLTVLEGAWPRPGRCFPFELVGCSWGWVGQITPQEGLCISKAQVRSKPVAQPGIKKLPPPLRALSLSCFRSQPHTNLRLRPDKSSLPWDLSCSHLVQEAQVIFSMTTASVTCFPRGTSCTWRL